MGHGLVHVVPVGAGAWGLVVGGGEDEKRHRVRTRSCSLPGETSFSAAFVPPRPLGAGLASDGLDFVSDQG